MKEPLFHSLQWKIAYTFLVSSLSSALLLIGLFSFGVTSMGRMKPSSLPIFPIYLPSSYAFFSQC